MREEHGAETPVLQSANPRLRGHKIKDSFPVSLMSRRWTIALQRPVFNWSPVLTLTAYPTHPGSCQSLARNQNVKPHSAWLNASAPQVIGSMASDLRRWSSGSGSPEYSTTYSNAASIQTVTAFCAALSDRRIRRSPSASR